MMSSSICVQQVRRMSQQLAMERLRTIPNEGLVWRTEETDPRKHTMEHEALFYVAASDDKDLMQIFGTNLVLDPLAKKFYKTIGNMPLMIRKPTLDAIGYLRSFRESAPNHRLLFYGDEGHGKSHALAHLQHYQHLMQDSIIITMKDVRKFSRSPWEIAESTSRPGRVDTPINAAMFLQQFRMQNAAMLEKLNDILVCSKDYSWSLREVTKAGEPIANIAQQGVNRLVHASDCAAVLIKELMLAADSGKTKIVSFLDNIRYLFADEMPNFRHTDIRMVFVDEVTVARAIKKLIRGQQKNSIVIATCEEHLTNRQNQTPKDVLGLEGWNHFDPFLPIHMPKYSRKEFESCMNFYQDIKWLTRPESRTVQVRDEIRFLSALNPRQVFKICQPL